MAPQADLQVAEHSAVWAQGLMAAREAVVREEPVSAAVLAAEAEAVEVEDAEVVAVAAAVEVAVGADRMPAALTTASTPASAIGAARSPLTTVRFHSPRRTPF